MNKPHQPARKKMSDIKRSTLIVSIALVLTLLIGVLAITGLPLDSRGLYRIKSWVPFVSAANWPSSVPMGLGVGGGTYTEFTTTLPEGNTADKEAALDAAVSILQNRLTQKGYLDSIVKKTAEGNIRVEIPSAKDRDIVLADLVSSGDLKFSFPDGVFLEGSHVKSATVGTVANGNQQSIGVTVDLDARGTRALSDATTANSSKVMTVTMDGGTVLSMTIEEAIINGQIVISGISTLEDARNLAVILRSGALPVTLAKATAGDVAATQGDFFLQLFVIGGLVLMLACIAYFAARYVLGGLAFGWALWLHVIITYFAMAVFPMPQLTLLGLIGIALVFGLFVWANAIFLDKFSLGLRPGRMHKVSLKEGWQDVRVKVWKTHGVIAACALVLIILPIGFLHSFAYAVFYGTVSSLAVTFIASRALLYSFAHLTKMKAGLFGRVKNV